MAALAVSMPAVSAHDINRLSFLAFILISSQRLLTAVLEQSASSTK
jgi:hypothetical protein